MVWRQATLSCVEQVVSANTGRVLLCGRFRLIPGKQSASHRKGETDGKEAERFWCGSDPTLDYVHPVTRAICPPKIEWR